MSSASTAKTAAKPGLPPAAKMPGEVVRGLVSLWILLHFFAVILGIATGTPMGTSQLLARIKRAPILDQYLFALWLDVGHTYVFTSGQLDGDYSLETDLIYADGHTETKNLQPDGAHGERLERYRALAMRSAAGAEFETPDTSVPYHVGGALLKQLKDAGVKEVVFRVRRHAPLSMADANGSDPGQRDPNNPRSFSTLATISVTLNSSDQPQVQVKARSATDVAPVTNPTQTPPNRKSGSTKQGPSDQSGTTPSSTIRPPPAPLKLPGDAPNFDSSKILAPNSPDPETSK
jgi:hypothetical protein